MNLIKKAAMVLSLCFLITATTGCGGTDEPEPTEPAETTTVETTTAETTTSETTAEETQPQETEPAPSDDEPTLLWSHKHENRLQSVTMTPDGTALIVGEYLTGYMHRLADGELMDVFIFPHTAQDLEVSPDGRYLAGGFSVYGVSLFDLQERTLDDEGHQLHGGYNNRVAFSPDSRTLVTGNRSDEFWFWDVESKEDHKELVTDLNDYLTTIVWHPDGRLLATGRWTDDATIEIWDVETDSVVHRIDLHILIGSTNNPFAFSPDGNLMAAAIREDREDFLRLYTVEGFAPIGDIAIPRNTRDIAFSPDSSLLAIATQDEVHVLDVESQTLLYVLDQEDDPEESDWNIEVEFSPDGGYLAVVRWDGTVELWRFAWAGELEVPPIDMRTPPPLPGDVLFDTGSAELKEEASPELEAFAADLLASVNQATITFIGHTDSRGSAADNMQLSLDRAQSLKDWFTDWASEQDAGGWTLEAEGRGDTELKVPDVDNEGTFLPEAGAINRRVEIEISDD